LKDDDAINKDEREDRKDASLSPRIDEAEEIILIEESPTKPKGKRIRWALGDEFEDVKFFKLTDLPTSEGLTIN
jgi:hypothetical protein